MSTAALSPRPGWPMSRLLTLLILVGLPLLAFEVRSVFDLRQAREAEIREEASRLLDLVEAEQLRIVEDIHHVLLALTAMGIGRMDAPTCMQAMGRIRQTYPAYLALNVAAKDGPIWCSTEPTAVGMSVADRPYRQEALHTDGVITDPYILSRTTGRPAIPFARAYLGEDGSPAGSVAALLDIVWLEHYLAQKSLPQHAAVLIADSAGTILARVPEVSGLSGQILPERFRPLLQRTTNGIVEQPGMDGVPRIIAYSPVGAGASGLYFQVSLDKAVAMRAVNAATLRSLLLFLGLLSLAGFGATWGVRRFLRVRDQAQQNALRTTAVLASTVDGVVEIDREWRFTYLNDKAKALIGQGRDLLGQTLWDVFPELVNSPVWDKAHQVITEQVPVDAELQGLRTGRWFWMRAFPSPNGLAVYLLDITRRQQAEEALRESKDRLSLALESAQAGTFDWDLRTGRGYWSEESYRIFGLDPQQHPASNEAWLNVVHPDDVERAGLAGQQHFLAERKPDFRLEYRVLHPDGSVRWVSSVGRIRYDADGTPLRFSGLNIDITERKTMEEALRRSEERLSIALAAAEAGIWDFDVHARSLTWSEGTYRLFGLDPDRFTPSENSFYELIHPDDRAAVRQVTREVLEAKRPDFRMEYRITHPQKGVRWILDFGRAVHDRAGQPMRLSGLNIDITARKAMEQALREAKATADEASRSKSKFLAAASHDLRQPLQSALLFAGVLHRYVSDEQGRRPLESLERALDTLKNLLDSLLDVSRLDAGVIVPQPADTPLGPLLEEISAAYAPIAASKGLDFHVEPPCADLAVRSDPLLLGRMLRNLVENAIRYTEQGHVRVRCALIPDGVCIQVHDSGIGIAAEHLGKVFEEFHQVGNPERDRSQGLGLGLAIVQRLSQLLRHPVAVRSEPGRGSVFSIEVPRAAGPAEPLPASETPAVTTGRGRLAVLVDDDAIVLTGLQTLFHEWGYDVVIAGSAEQVLERLRTIMRVPDLIIADYRLRDGKTGTDAIVRVRGQAGQPVPGIILTGEIGPECARDAASHGLAVVHKPITPRQLQATVQRLLGLDGD